MTCKANSAVLPKWQESDANACVVDYCKNLMDTARKESCGKCVLCREGTWQVYEIIKDITEGNGQSEDFELLLEILEQMDKNAKCEMSRTAASICIDLMKAHEEEWDKHIRRKRCSNLVCKGTYTVYVDPQLCDGCGKCLESCPHGAIAGKAGMIHVINPNMCSKSMICMSVCPKGAIKKAGAVKPKLPSEPVPVGSFDQPSAGQEGETMMRRRRRR
ncbi:4Fe-4S dicluster domain-containing protein [Biomaibacter acetigenes]|uniref:4Fe-4S dicluster domain-containing protein n=1 Tax=Biomaibacter acetigenes TaxID=2316383 RepID=A0A3G2R1Q8_9FIRM|nr:NADH-ubiquinone oxidoreductase-F iron-sulfur binding region domain-containing protein [Biomaibacter acetigenes]AYO29396.1 4Fe-4S dicluster domain-containing protein [Biomaibacter acetigenes]